MGRVRVCVHEVNTRGVGVYVEQNELAVPTGDEKRPDCVLVGNGHGAVGECDGGGRIHRIQAHRIAEFGDVVDAVAVAVGRVGDQILLHPVTLYGQCRHVLGQRGRARFTQLHRDRQFHLRAVHIVPHVEHEVVVGRGRDHDGNSLHRHLHRHRVIATSWTRHAPLRQGVTARQQQEGRENEDSALAPVMGVGRVPGSREGWTARPPTRRREGQRGSERTLDLRRKMC